jgi:hypothetical protein
MVHALARLVCRNQNWECRSRPASRRTSAQRLAALMDMIEIILFSLPRSSLWPKVLWPSSLTPHQTCDGEPWKFSAINELQ